MKAESSADLGLCGAYEELLRDCEQALEAWSARSEKIRQIHLTGAEVGAELLTLQVRFARAYTTLSAHTEICQRCSFLAKRTSSRESDGLHTRTPYSAWIQ